MKRSTLITLILILIASAVFAGWYANSVREAKDSATKAVNTYIDAVKVGNVEEAMRLSRDKRFIDEKARQESYQQLFKDSPLQQAEITNLERIDNTEMTVTLSIKGEKTGTQEVTIPLILDEETNQWKLLLDRMKIKEPTK
jgi:hypothetical protein